MTGLNTGSMRQAIGSSGGSRREMEANMGTAKDSVRPSPPRRARVRRIRAWRAWLTFRTFAIFAIVLMAVRSAVADWNDVPTGSMKPTILEGDRIFVNKLAYDLKLPFTTFHLLTLGNPKRGVVVGVF